MAQVRPVPVPRESTVKRLNRRNSLRSVPVSLGDAQNRASLSQLLYWSGTRISVDQFENALEATTETDFSSRILNATGFQSAQSLLETAKANRDDFYHEASKILPHKEYFVRRLLLWFFFCPHSTSVLFSLLLYLNPIATSRRYYGSTGDILPLLECGSS